MPEEDCINYSQHILFQRLKNYENPLFIGIPTIPANTLSIKLPFKNGSFSLLSQENDLFFLLHDLMPQNTTFMWRNNSLSRVFPHLWSYSVNGNSLVFDLKVVEKGLKVVLGCEASI